MRGKGHKAVGHVRKFVPCRLLPAGGGRKGRVAIAAAYPFIRFNRVVHRGTLCPEVSKNRRVSPDKGWVPQQPPQGEGAPCRAGIRADTLCVQPAGQRAERFPVLAVALKHLNDPCRLLGCGNVTRGTLSPDGGFPFRETKGRAAAKVHPGFRPSEVVVGYAPLNGFPLKLGENHHDLRHHGTRQAVVKGDPVRDRLELDALFGQLLAQPCEVMDAAADTVDLVNQDLFDPACRYVIHQPPEGWTVRIFAGKALVGIGFTGFQFACGQFRAAGFSL